MIGQGLTQVARGAGGAEEQHQRPHGDEEHAESGIAFVDDEATEEETDRQKK